MKNNLYDFDGFMLRYADKSIKELNAAHNSLIRERWEKENIFVSDNLEDLSSFDCQIERALLGKLIMKRSLDQEVVCPTCGLWCDIMAKTCKKCRTELRDSLPKKIELGVLENWYTFDWNSGVDINNASPDAIPLFFSHRNFFYIPVVDTYYAVSPALWDRRVTIIEKVTRDDLLDVINTRIASEEQSGDKDALAYWNNIYWKLVRGYNL